MLAVPIHLPRGVCCLCHPENCEVGLLLKEQTRYVRRWQVLAPDIASLCSSYHRDRPRLCRQLLPGLCRQRRCTGAAVQEQAATTCSQPEPDQLQLVGCPLRGNNAAGGWKVPLPPERSSLAAQLRQRRSCLAKHLCTPQDTQRLSGSSPICQTCHAKLAGAVP